MLDVSYIAAIAQEGLVHEPASYAFQWTIIGLLFLLLAIGIICLVFFLTRKKPIKNLSSLKAEAPKAIDLSAIRAKYLAFVAEVESKYSSNQIKASEAHQSLSLIIRTFYAEAGGFHAEFLTLNDLKRTSKTTLAEAIEGYYPDEFDLLEKGSVASSAERAKNIIMADEAAGRRFASKGDQA